MARLIFTGDVMLGRLVNEYLQKQADKSLIWGNTLETLRNADLTFINLECALTRETKRGTKTSPVFFFRSEPEHAATLRTAGIDYCSLANNHVLDFGEKGLLETLHNLKNTGIAYSGAGSNIKEAKQLAEFDIENLKIKVFSFTDNEPFWEAGKDKPGIFYLPIKLSDKRVIDFFNRIKKEKSKGSIVIVSAHWGPNMVRVPPEKHVEFAHALVDIGCDIFHGHSSHVFQGIEIYKGKVIFYDCGEFLDDYAVDSILRNDESFLYEVGLEGDNITEIDLYPILIDNLQVNQVSSEEGEEISQKMLELCKSFKTRAELRKEGVKISI